MLRIRNTLCLASLFILLAGCLEVKITSPAPGTKFTAGKSITFMATIEDVDAVTKKRTPIKSSARTMEWRVDGVVDKGQTGRSFTVKGLTVGRHTISVRGEYINSAGQKEQQQDSISIEITKKPPVSNTLPVVTITDPARRRRFTPGQPIRFSGNAMDKEDGAIPVSALTWKANGQVIQSGTDTISHILAVTNKTGQRSTHVITLEAVDSAGGVSKKDMTVYVSNEIPLVTITPSSGTILLGQPISFTVSAIDAEDGPLPASSLNWTYDGQPISVTGNKLDIPNVSAGTHTVTVQAADQYGVVGKGTYQFIPIPQGTNTRGFRTFSLVSSARDVTDIVAEPFSNMVLLATNGDGLVRLDPMGNETSITFASTQGELPSDDISALGRTYNSIWVGTANHGLSLTSGSGNNWKSYKSTSLNNLASNEVYSIAVDTDSKWMKTGDNVYFGTEYGYENYLPGVPGDEGFDQYFTVRQGEITDIAVHQDNGWIGTDGDGLQEYKPSPTSDGPKHLPGMYITSLEIDKGNAYVFAGTMSQGLNVYDPSSQAFAKFTTSSSPMPSDNITDIALTSNGTAYVGTRSGGLVKLSGFNGITGTFVTFNTQNSGIKDNEIVSVAVDPDNGNVWIGHPLGGVSLLVP